MTTTWTSCFSRTNTLPLLAFTLILRTVIEALQVIGGNITVVQGETAILPCKLIDTTEHLTQISWQKMTRGNPINVNFFTVLDVDGPQFVNGRDDRFKFIGNFKENIATLQLSNVKLMDEGTYTCIFTLFPSGNHKTDIPLNLLVPPVSSLEDNHPTLGNEEVSLVTCIAASSKPPALVRWLVGSLGETVRETTNFTQHANGTTTTTSSLFGVPTKEVNGHSVQCVVTSAATLEEETLSFDIQVYFSPTDVNISERSKGSFECVTEANPNADFIWSRKSQPWPQLAVKVDGATLQFPSMTSDLNGLYQCEASNPYGKKHSYLYVHVTDASNTGWILFGLLLISLLLIALVAAVWYFYYSGRFTRTGEHTRGERTMVPTTCNSPEEPQRVEEEAVEDSPGQSSLS
ncbi:poliovirus receptor homolog isoform X1 [Etheostoma spectabile]|uniref:poliovirus receptor homolog isoform X1 n=1 Tax=Etheostoma spectabile TaxID=54343 RepID=UPI0013AEFCBC|nr:poliovirus receptor homolog isoform X1 [Etheostoma spectabile]